jgi:hypothetical protein
MFGWPFYRGAIHTKPMRLAGGRTISANGGSNAEITMDAKDQQ